MKCFDSIGFSAEKVLAEPFNVSETGNVCYPKDYRQCVADSENVEAYLHFRQLVPLKSFTGVIVSMELFNPTLREGQLLEMKLSLESTRKLYENLKAYFEQEPA